MAEYEAFASATGFLGRVGPFLERDEAVSGLLLGLAAGLADKPPAGPVRPYLAAVTDPNGPVLAALMMPARNLILYAEQLDQGALRLLAVDLLDRKLPVPGVVAPLVLAEAFAATWCELTANKSRVLLRERLYQLRQVLHPHYSPGRLRLATAAETELVLQWMNQFYAEAIPDDPPPSYELYRDRVAGNLAYFWDDNGPACIAFKTRATRHGIAISDVYTPPSVRRRGYASSCVAALSQHLLDDGYEYCTLFTDLANPSSNSIYEQIGYRPVADFLSIGFGAAQI